MHISKRKLPNCILGFEPQAMAQFQPLDFIETDYRLPQRSRTDSETCRWPFENENLNVVGLDGDDAVA